MTRVMYDSIHASAIPTTAAMVAGYLAPSPFAWSAADWARFPHAVHVRIAVRASTNDGHVLDVEKGDATPAQAPAWVLARRAAGMDPTVYCSLANWSAVKAAFAAAKVVPPHYWIAHYGAGPDIPAGAIAVQYAAPPNSGGDWDLSVVADYWPGVDNAQEDEMLDPTDPIVQNLEAGANAVQFGLTGVRSAGPLALAVSQLAVQITATQGALATEHAAVIAAIQAIPAPVAQQITADPTAVAAALESAGLPAEVGQTLLAALAKAAS
jgi:hypothetical protein